MLPLRIIILLSLFFVGASLALADEFKANNFTILDPIISSPGGYQSSDSYKFQGSLSEIAVGTSTAASFNLQAGFFFFPEVTLPVLTATAGDGSVTLSWTTAEGFLGWNVSGYSIGQAQVSGGPYAYTSVGNVTSSTVTGLTNGTTYYFVILPEDAFNIRIATSTEDEATPTGGGSPDGGGGGGSGGGLIGFLGQQFLPSTFCSDKRLGDLNCDGQIDLRDFSIFLALLPTKTPNPADFNTDSLVNFTDLSLLLAGWSGDFINFKPEPAAPVLVEQPVSRPSLLSRVSRASSAAIGSVLNQFKPPELKLGWWNQFNRFISRVAETIVNGLSSLFNFTP